MQFLELTLDKRTMATQYNLRMFCQEWHKEKSLGQLEGKQKAPGSSQGWYTVQVWVLRTASREAARVVYCTGVGTGER